MVNVDVQDLIDDFRLDGGIVVERRTEPTLDTRGEAVDDTAELIEISDVALHTASERDLQRLPEADRRKEAIRVYTKVKLRTAGDGYAADVVRYDDKRYEVAEVADYERQGAVWLSTCLLMEATT